MKRPLNLITKRAFIRPFSTLLSHFVRERRINKEDLANHIGVSVKTISSWLSGNVLPSRRYFASLQLFIFENVDINQNIENNAQKLLDAYISAQLDIARENDDLALFLKISNAQCVSVMTYLSEGSCLVSVALNIDFISNSIQNVRTLTAIPKSSGLECQLAESIEDFFNYLNGEGATRETVSNLYGSINNDAAIIFRGSVESANLKTLSKLPALIKGLASLSPRQFRVGIVRLGTSIVVISIAASGGTFITWELARELQNLGVRAAHYLSTVGLGN